MRRIGIGSIIEDADRCGRHIKTKSRTVLSYLLSPLARYKQEKPAGALNAQPRAPLHRFSGIRCDRSA
jgi:hypothetical protein